MCRFLFRRLSWKEARNLRKQGFVVSTSSAAASMRPSGQFPRGEERGREAGHERAVVRLDHERGVCFAMLERHRVVRELNRDDVDAPAGATRRFPRPSSGRRAGAAETIERRPSSLRGSRSVAARQDDVLLPGERLQRDVAESREAGLMVGGREGVPEPQAERAEPGRRVLVVVGVDAGKSLPEEIRADALLFARELGERPLPVTLVRTPVDRVRFGGRGRGGALARRRRRRVLGWRRAGGAGVRRRGRRVLGALVRRRGRETFLRPRVCPGRQPLVVGDRLEPVAAPRLRRRSTASEILG